MDVFTNGLQRVKLESCHFDIWVGLDRQSGEDYVE